MVIFNSYASPLPFALRFPVFNDTEARRSICHRLFRAFLAFPPETLAAQLRAGAGSDLRVRGAFAAGYCTCSITSCVAARRADAV